MGIMIEDEESYLRRHLEINELVKHGLTEAEKIRRKRTINTALMIKQHLANINFMDLTTNQYFTVDKSAMPFIRKYEFQMEGAALDIEKFTDGLDAFYTKMAQEIKKGDNLEIFMALFHAWDERFHKLNDSHTQVLVGSCYMDLLLQQMEYLSDSPGYIICGITTDGELITCADAFPNVDLPNYNISERNMFLRNGKVVEDKTKPEVYLEDIIKEYARYGYKVRNYKEMEYLQTTSQIWTNGVSTMAFFINEYTMDMLIKEPFWYNSSFCLPRKWKPTQLYEEALKHRKYLLPSNGVYAEYRNAGSIKGIRFREVIKNDTVYLIYLADTDNGQIAGYYNTKTDAFYSAFAKTTQPELEAQMKNFILENYYRLTVRDIDFSKKKLSCMIVTNDFEQAIKSGFTQNQPIVRYCFYGGKQRDFRQDGGGLSDMVLVDGKKVKAEKDNKEGLKVYKPYDREKYRSEQKSINGYVRRLPIGSRASEEAMNYASLLGIELDSNETYVRPFIKTVLKVK